MSLFEVFKLAQLREAVFVVHLLHLDTGISTHMIATDKLMHQESYLLDHANEKIADIRQQAT